MTIVFPTIELSLWDHLIAALYLVGLPFIVSQSSSRKESTDTVMTTRDKVSTYLSSSLSLWILASPVILLWLAKRRQWSNLGLDWTQPIPPAWWLLVGLVLWLAIDTWVQLATPLARAKTRARWQRDTPFMPATAIEAIAATPLAFSAGLCEEIIYRGFLILYAVSLFGASAAVLTVAILVGSITHGLLHAYQDRTRQIKSIVLAIGLGFLYFLAGSLWPAILLHAAIDLVMFWLSLSILGREAEPSAG